MPLIEAAVSALPLRADMVRTDIDVRYVPEADALIAGSRLSVVLCEDGPARRSVVELLGRARGGASGNRPHSLCLLLDRETPSLRAGLGCVDRNCARSTVLDACPRVRESTESRGDGDGACSSRIGDISAVLPARFVRRRERGTRQPDEQLDGIESPASAFLGERRSLAWADHQRKMDRCRE